MIRLLVPLAGIVVVLPAVAGRRCGSLQPREPRLFFLGYALLLLAGGRATSTCDSGRSSTIDDALGSLRCLLLQVLMCLTMWNAFYSLLWGFSGGLMHDLYNDAALRDRGAARSDRTRATARLDRILARRLPNLDAGG